MLKQLGILLVCLSVVYTLNGRTMKSLSVEQKMDKINELTRRANELPFVEKKLKEKNWFTKIDDCPEFSVFQNYTLWEYPRLPKTVVPTDYLIELYTPIFQTELYAGLAVITAELNEDTDTFIIHSKLVAEQGIALLDKNGNEIAIKCAGYYPVNDYFVIRTTNKVQRSQGPLLLEYLFIGFLNIYESGLFEVKYEGGTRDNLLASHFEPEDARKAFPCFDEPSFKARFEFLIDHPNDTIALSNMPPQVTLLSYFKY
jgi:hypothetical protein